MGAGHGDSSCLSQGGLENFSGAVLLNADCTYWPKGAVT